MKLCCRLIVCISALLIFNSLAYSQNGNGENKKEIEIPQYLLYESAADLVKVEDLITLYNSKCTLLYRNFHNQPPEELILINQDSFADALYKLLQKLEKNSANFVYLNALVSTRSIDKKEILTLFDQYPQTCQESEIGQKIRNRLFDSNEGTGGPEIKSFLSSTELVTLNGTSTNLESIYAEKSKYFILAFGASWCHPCKVQDKILDEKYKSANIKDVKIVHISVDAEFKNWKESEQKMVHKRNAFHIKGGSKSELAKALRFTTIPRYFVTNEKAEILFWDIDATRLIQKLDAINLP